MRNEYPRPELVRADYKILNGNWEFDFDFGDSGVFQEFFKKDSFSKTINVPFCPESKLSGIEYKDYIPSCWYMKKIRYDEYKSGRLLINFEASYHKTEIYVNGVFVDKHVGGYTAFTFDITDYFKKGEENIICVHTTGDPRDPTQPCGKQTNTKYESWGCWYTRTSGIYGTLWLEIVPESYLKSYKCYPDITNSSISFDFDLVGNGQKEIELDISFKGEHLATKTIKTTQNFAKTTVELSKLYLWDIGQGNLYDLIIKVKSNGSVDTVNTYFGMREVKTVGKDFYLNGRKIFQRLVLDQGYHPDGVLTFPSADIFKADIERALACGFNGARMHQRVFDRLYIHEADKLGFLTWGEYACWGFDNSLPDGEKYFIPEWREAMERDFNHPSIVCWCPFNETFEFWNASKNPPRMELIKNVFDYTKNYDKTRPVQDASGNYHVKTDIYGIHTYEQNVEKFAELFEPMKKGGEVYDNYPTKQSYNGSVYMVDEYGGISSVGDSGGYGATPKGLEEFLTRLEGLTDVLVSNPYIAGFCYTQLYDVEQEKNGIYKYDRSPKYDEETTKKIKNIIGKSAEYEK